VNYQKTKAGDASSGKAIGRRTARSARKLPQTGLQGPAQPGTVLLVEDNPEDAFMVGRAFRTVAAKNALVVLRDGEQAVRYLKGEGEYGDRLKFPIPELILLDLNMPGMNGFEVLTWVRQQPAFTRLPVIILTTSTYSPDVRQAYRLGANSFLTKPTDFMKLVSEVKAMADFWLNQPSADAANRQAGTQPTTLR